MPQKKSKAEGERKGKRGCEEKTMKCGAVMCWNMVVKKKQGKNESNARIRKRKNNPK